MTDLERTFRDGLRQAVAERPGDIRVDVDEVIARASSPDFVPETRWTPPRWLAAAAAVLVVAGLGVGLTVFRPSAGIPATPSAPLVTPSASTQLDAADLVGSKWRAVQIDGRSVTSIGTASAPSLSFTSATQVLTNDGCNTGFRGYKLKPSGVRLDFSFGMVGAQTEIGCNPAQQQRFTKALDETTQARLGSDLLEFLNPNGEVVLRFERFTGIEPTQPPSGVPTNSFAVTVSTPYESGEPTPTSPPTSTGAVYVRLYNDTGVTVHKVKVGFPEGVVISEATMAPGAYSEYVRPEVAYRIASLQATADGHPYRTTPTDYVGEKPLEPGNYTYSIRLVEGAMFLEFGQD